MKGLLFLAVSVIVSASAFAQVVETSKGKVLSSESKMTLYTYDKDSDGKSTCNGPCAENWQPYADNIEIAPASSAGRKSAWGFITRDDGRRMFTYDGKPVYLFKNDKAPGD